MSLPETVPQSLAELVNGNATTVSEWESYSHSLVSFPASLIHLALMATQWSVFNRSGSHSVWGLGPSPGKSEL